MFARRPLTSQSTRSADHDAQEKDEAQNLHATEATTEQTNRVIGTDIPVASGFKALSDLSRSALLFRQRFDLLRPCTPSEYYRNIEITPYNYYRNNADLPVTNAMNETVQLNVYVRVMLPSPNSVTLTNFIQKSLKVRAYKQEVEIGNLLGMF